MSASRFTFDVSRAVEELCLRCQQDGHDEPTFLRAAINEINELLLGLQRVLNCVETIGRAKIADRAHLISAAPELLEACKKAVIVLENENTSFSPSLRESVLDILTDINTAIAKAEGNEQKA